MLRNPENVNLLIIGAHTFVSGFVDANTLIIMLKFIAEKFAK